MDLKHVLSLMCIFKMVNLRACLYATRNKWIEMEINHVLVERLKTSNQTLKKPEGPAFWGIISYNGKKAREYEMRWDTWEIVQ